MEEGEKATWRTSVCVFEANDEDLKTYVQVCCTIQVLNDRSYLHNIVLCCYSKSVRNIVKIMFKNELRWGGHVKAGSLLPELILNNL